MGQIPDWPSILRGATSDSALVLISINQPVPSPGCMEQIRTFDRITFGEAPVLHYGTLIQLRHPILVPGRAKTTVTCAQADGILSHGRRLLATIEETRWMKERFTMYLFGADIDTKTLQPSKGLSILLDGDGFLVFSELLRNPPADRQDIAIKLRRLADQLEGK